MGDQVVRISYHKRMYGLGEVSFLARWLHLGSSANEVAL